MTSSIDRVAEDVSDEQVDLGVADGGRSDTRRANRNAPWLFAGALVRETTMGLHVRVEVVLEHFVVARCDGKRLELAKSQLEALPAAEAPRILNAECEIEAAWREFIHTNPSMGFRPTFADIRRVFLAGRASVRAAEPPQPASVGGVESVRPCRWPTSKRKPSQQSPSVKT